MQKTRKIKKIFYRLLVVWVLWYLPMLICMPVFHSQYINIICGMGIALTITSIVYVLYRIQDVWEDDRKETIRQINKYLFEKYLGDIQCIEGKVPQTEKERNII